MADGFLSRWSRLKAEAREPELADPNPAVAVPVQAPAAQEPPQAAERILPTLEDAQRLGPQSDYSAFVARGVDPSVRRLALRKLFSDPHFNIGDGLDVYMGDYTRSDPISPAMLASLSHAGAWLGLGPKEEEAEAGELSLRDRPQPLDSTNGGKKTGDSTAALAHRDSPDQQDQQQPDAHSTPAREHDEH